MSHLADVTRVLRTLSKRRTNSVKATVALVHATLEVADAVRDQTVAVNRQTDTVVRLWNEDK